MTKANQNCAKFSDQSAAATALEHARSMLQFQAKLRVKNFNFFLVLAGAIAVALNQWVNYHIRGVLCFFGLVLAGVFFFLDVRGARLVKDARFDLYRFEKRFGLTIHDTDRVADRTRTIIGGRRLRIFSHTFCYRLVFVLVAFLFLLSGLVFFGMLKHHFAMPVPCKIV